LIHLLVITLTLLILSAHQQENEYHAVKNKIQEAQKEMVLVNDAKLRARQDKTNIKNQMIADMEDFSKELQVAKHNISSTQEVIIGTIRDKMESSFAAWEQGQASTNRLYSPGFLNYHTSSSLSPAVRTTNPPNSNSILKQESRLSFDSRASAQDNDIGYLLNATGAVSMEALISDLQQSEEYIFRSSYLLPFPLLDPYPHPPHSTVSIKISRTRVLSSRRVSSKTNNSRAKWMKRWLSLPPPLHFSFHILQTKSLVEVESHNRTVREDLEQHIHQIQKSITVYENAYNSNMQILGTISECLISILRNVRLRLTLSS
jgi:predicted Holliday junction resolvase-like endonuclease